MFMPHREDAFWRALPVTIDDARALWGDGDHSAATRIEFEDQLFRLRQAAGGLRLGAIVQLLSTLEAFVVAVPLDASAARQAWPGIDAGLRLLDALRHPNVSIHDRALEALFTRLSRDMTASRLAPDPYNPTFEPPRPGGRS